MKSIATLKSQAETFFALHEQAITALLIGVAVLLILVAIFGKPHHKALACLYIVL